MLVMSKRKNVKKPSYVISDSDGDDEDFILPAAKRSKSSQDKLIRTRGNVGDRALERDLERAKQLSLHQKKTQCTRHSSKESTNRSESKRSGKNCSSPDSSGSVNNVANAKKRSKQILISSESDTEPSQPAPKTDTKPSVDGGPLHRRSVVTCVSGAGNVTTKHAQQPVVRRVSGAGNVTTKHAQQPVVTADKQEPYSDDEFGISPPDSTEHSSSEQEFKLSQISSEPSEKDVSSDEEFRLDSEDDEFTPEKKKPKVKPKQSKAVALPKTAISAASTKKASVPTNVSREKCVISAPLIAGTKRTLQSVVSRPSSRTLKPATSAARTVNIPALLSSSQSPSAPGSSPLGIKIGLSKKAKFKSLHANIKRN